MTDICKECGRPLSEHKIAVGFYTQPDGNEKDYEGYICPPELSEGDLSDGRNEIHIQQPKRRNE